MDRCNLFWYSRFGMVQCIHPRGVHWTGRHESEQTYRDGRHPSFIAVGHEDRRPMNCYWG